MERRDHQYKDAAEEIGVELSTCWRWANGKASPQVWQLKALKKYGKTTLEAVVDLFDEPA